MPAHANRSGQCPFALGDNVRVELDVEIFKMMQEGHGDYDDQLLEVSILVVFTSSVLDHCSKINW